MRFSIEGITSTIPEKIYFRMLCTMRLIVEVTKKSQKYQVLFISMFMYTYDSSGISSMQLWDTLFLINNEI